MMTAFSAAGCLDVPFGPELKQVGQSQAAQAERADAQEFMPREIAHNIPMSVKQIEHGNRLPKEREVGIFQWLARLRPERSAPMNIKAVCLAGQDRSRLM